MNKIRRSKRGGGAPPSVTKKVTKRRTKSNVCGEDSIDSLDFAQLLQPTVLPNDSSKGGGQILNEASADLNVVLGLEVNSSRNLGENGSKNTQNEVVLNNLGVFEVEGGDEDSNSNPDFAMNNLKIGDVLDEQGANLDVAIGMVRDSGIEGGIHVPISASMNLGDCLSDCALKSASKNQGESMIESTSINTLDDGKIAGNYGDASLGRGGLTSGLGLDAGLVAGGKPSGTVRNVGKLGPGQDRTRPGTRSRSKSRDPRDASGTIGDVSGAGSKTRPGSRTRSPGTQPGMQPGTSFVALPNSSTMEASGMQLHTETRLGTHPGTEPGQLVGLTSETRGVQPGTQPGTRPGTHTGSEKQSVGRKSLHVGVQIQGSGPGQSSTSLPPNSSSQRPSPSSLPLGANSAPKKSFSSLFHGSRLSSKGMKLRYIPPPDDEDDVCLDENDEIPFVDWGHLLIGCFTGPFPGRKALDDIVNKWGCSCKVLPYGKGWTVFKFSTLQDLEAVMDGGPYHTYGKTLMLKHVKKDTRLDDSLFTTIPVWAVFHEIPLPYWSESGLSKIVSRVGVPLHTDQFTCEKTRVNYARALVEIDVSKPPKTCFGVKINGERRYLQRVEYENYPQYCYMCACFGHNHLKCPKSNQVEENPIVQNRADLKQQERADLQVDFGADLGRVLDNAIRHSIGGSKGLNGMQKSGEEVSYKAANSGKQGGEKSGQFSSGVSNEGFIEVPKANSGKRVRGSFLPPSRSNLRLSYCTKALGKGPLRTPNRDQNYAKPKSHLGAVFQGTHTRIPSPVNVCSETDLVGSSNPFEPLVDMVEEAQGAKETCIGDSIGERRGEPTIPLVSL